MYGKPSKDKATIKESKRILIPIFILAGSLIVLGLFPSIVLNLIHPVIGQLQSIIPNVPIV
jgi:NADH:ubiquinone oxidoreductase subunit 4 (subunit M)